MTIPFERTRALVQTKDFLEAMLDPKQTPRMPLWMRGRAKALLRHYPGLFEIEIAHKALPETFGPVPPFSRLSGTADVQVVIDETMLSKQERKVSITVGPGHTQMKPWTAEQTEAHKSARLEDE